jgi:hypothetical protein
VPGGRGRRLSRSLVVVIQDVKLKKDDTESNPSTDDAESSPWVSDAESNSCQEKEERCERVREKKFFCLSFISKLINQSHMDTTM